MIGKKVPFLFLGLVSGAGLALSEHALSQPDIPLTIEIAQANGWMFAVFLLAMVGLLFPPMSYTCRLICFGACVASAAIIERAFTAKSLSEVGGFHQPGASPFPEWLDLSGFIVSVFQPTTLSFEQVEVIPQMAMPTLILVPGILCLILSVSGLFPVIFSKVSAVLLDVTDQYHPGH